MPPRISAEPDEHRGGELLVQDRRSVDEREAGHQVGDERQPRRAVQREHPKRMSCASAVPSRISASTDADRLPAGARWWAAGRARTAAGSGRRRASSPRRGPGRPCRRRRAVRTRLRSRRRARRGRPRARRRSRASRRSGWIPVTTATPTIPIPSPSARVPFSRSCGRNFSAISALKIGTDAWTTAARPESMCCSPQAISQKGTAALRAPRTRKWRHAGTYLGRACAPSRSARPRT